MFEKEKLYLKRVIGIMLCLGSGLLIYFYWVYLFSWLMIGIVLETNTRFLRV